jgi:hypothetical protein
MTVSVLPFKVFSYTVSPPPAVGSPYAIRETIFRSGTDSYDGGDMFIAGTTKNKDTPQNLPVSRRVRLHDQLSARLIREMWSDPITGQFRFDRLRPGSFYTVSFDHTGQYNGVISTNVISEPML